MKVKINNKKLLKEIDMSGGAGSGGGGGSDGFFDLVTSFAVNNPTISILAGLGALAGLVALVLRPRNTVQAVTDVGKGIPEVLVANANGFREVAEAVIPAARDFGKNKRQIVEKAIAANVLSPEVVNKRYEDTAEIVAKFSASAQKIVNDIDSGIINDQNYREPYDAFKQDAAIVRTKITLFVEAVGNNDRKQFFKIANEAEQKVKARIEQLTRNQANIAKAQTPFQSAQSAQQAINLLLKDQQFRRTGITDEDPRPLSEAEIMMIVQEAATIINAKPSFGNKIASLIRDKFLQ